MSLVTPGALNPSNHTVDVAQVTTSPKPPNFPRPRGPTGFLYTFDSGRTSDDCDFRPVMSTNESPTRYRVTYTYPPFASLRPSPHLLSPFPVPREVVCPSGSPESHVPAPPGSSTPRDPCTSSRAYTKSEVDPTGPGRDPKFGDSGGYAVTSLEFRVSE